MALKIERGFGADVRGPDQRIKYSFTQFDFGIIIPPSGPNKMKSLC